MAETAREASAIANLYHLDSYRRDELPEEGGSLSYGEIRPGAARNDATELEIVVHPYLVYSDYSGSLMERANVKAVLRDHDEHPDVFELIGGHGTHGIAIRADSTDEELIEILGALDDYPILDEDLEGELEIEAQNEAWEDWGRADLRRALEDLWGVDTEGWISDQQLDAMAFEIMDKQGIYWEREGHGGTVTLDLRQIATHIPVLFDEHRRRWNLMLQYWTPQGFINGDPYQEE